MHGAEKVKALSAGSRPSGKVNPKAVEAMQEIGYDLTKHTSKSLDKISQNEHFDYVITMGCGDECPYIPAKERIDWQIPGPRNMEKEDFNEVRNLIENKVRHFLSLI